MVTIKDRYGDSYKTEIEAFIKAIQEDTEVPVTGKDGLMAIVIAKAALLSDKERRIVKVSELMPKL